MDIAIVTGAETPLGLRIIEGLIQQGCRVHGIGNNLSKVTYVDRHFIAHAIDVSDLSAVQKTTSEILEKEGALHILIHAIDVTPGTTFEKLPVGNLEAILKIGLLGPVMLTRLVLPNLLRYRGQLINIIPANKSGHPASAINSLIEGGLREMNTALFNQARDVGFRVTNLILRQNTELPAATISDEQLEQTRIDPEQVARTVDYLLNANESNVPNEIILHPRLSAASKEALPENPLPVDPYNAIVLPPAEYCPPEQPKIPTKQPDQIDRTIPYSDEEMEEKIAAAIEDFEIHPERYEPKQKGPKQHSKRDKQKLNQGGDGGGTKPRRGRRRGGRNRNRDEKDQSQVHAHKAENESHNTSPEKSAEPKAQPTHSDSENASNKPNRNNRRRRGSRKPEPHKEQVSNEVPKKTTQHSSKPKQPTPVTKPKPQVTKSKPTAKTDSTPKADAKPASKAKTNPTPKAKPAKKMAKKAAKKASTKKKVAKKVVKKTATKKVPTKKVTKKATKKAVKKKVVKKAE